MEYTQSTQGSWACACHLIICYGHLSSLSLLTDSSLPATIIILPVIVTEFSSPSISGLCYSNLPCTLQQEESPRDSDVTGAAV